MRPLVRRSCIIPKNVSMLDIKHASKHTYIHAATICGKQHPRQPRAQRKTDRAVPASSGSRSRPDGHSEGTDLRKGATGSGKSSTCISLRKTLGGASKGPVFLREAWQEIVAWFAQAWAGSASRNRNRTGTSAESAGVTGERKPRGTGETGMRWKPASSSNTEAAAWIGHATLRAFKAGTETRP